MAGEETFSLGQTDISWMIWKENPHVANIFPLLLLNIFIGFNNCKDSHSASNSAFSVVVIMLVIIQDIILYIMLIIMLMP